MKRYLPAIFACLIYHIASAQNTSSVSIPKWLTGKWENQTQRGRMVEEWSKLNDSTYTGKSYMITATDSLPLESIVLKKEGNDIFYIPTVKGQNNEQPVKFKLTSSSPDQLVFENPAHDFPQKIIYTLENANSLTAEISGIINGQRRARKFPMKKTEK